MSESGRNIAKAKFPWNICLGGCLFSLALFVITSAASGIAPLGSTSFLSEDLAYQYLDFFAWLRRALTGQTSLLYVANQALGENAWGMIGYYLSSPLNLLVVLFPEDQLNLFVWVITGLKLTLMGGTFAWYLRRRFDLASPWCLALALCVVWSTWTVTEMRNPMWLDAFVLLPLAMQGLHAFVREGRWRLLLISVAAMVITCWYTAYMCVLFLVLLAIVELVELSAERPLAGRLLARRIGGLVAIGIGALLLSAFTFLPTVLTMAGDANNVTIETETLLCTPRQLFTSFFFGSWTYTKQPQLYGGMLLLIMGVLAFVSRSVPRRAKVAAGVVLAFLLASAIVTALQVVWCGLRVPSGFYCRSALFVIIFMVWLAAHVARTLSMPAMAPRRFVIALVTIVICLWALAAYAIGWDLVTLPHALASAVLALVYGVAIFVGAPASISDRQPAAAPRWLGVAVVVLVAAELAANAVILWDDIYYYPVADCQTYMAQSDQQTAEVQAADDSAYRIGKSYTRRNASALNEGMAHGYLELSTYSSSNDDQAIRLLEDLGLGLPGDYSVRYTPTNPVLDALLGVKYVGLSEPTGSYEDVGLTVGQYDASSERTYRLYHNSDALSLGYGVSASAVGLTLTTGSAATTNPFENQNALVSALVGHEVQLYVPATATLVSSDADARVWSVTLPTDGSRVFAYLQSSHDATISVGDAEYREGWAFGQSFIPVTSTDGTAATVTMTRGQHTYLHSEEAIALSDGDQLLFYQLDENVFAQVLQELGRDQATFTSFENGHICGSFTATSDDEMLLLTIPNADGWTVSVNGQTVQPQGTCEDGLMLIPVSAGENTFELTYVSPGLVPGCVISLIALVVCIILWRRECLQ